MDQVGVTTKIKPSGENPEYVAVEVSGTIRKVEFQGTTHGIHLGLVKLDEIQRASAPMVGAVNRTDGSGRPLSWGTRVKIQDAIADALLGEKKRLGV